jgi:hypothetical protein
MRVLADGRVRRTRSEWQSILKRYEKSGLSGTAFCEREEISPSSFAEWKRKLGKVASTRPSRPRFVELTKPVAVPVMPPVPSHGRGEFELSLPGGVVLRWSV